MQDVALSFEMILPNLFENAIERINPDADCDVMNSLREIILDPIYQFASKQAKPQEFWKKHIVSRAAFATLAITAIITCVAEAILGCSAAFLAFATLGHFDKVNSVAYHHLAFPGAALGALLAFKCVLKP